jgi:putative DNA primase/helicase
VTSPASWRPFPDALDAVRRFGLDGVGFAFSSADPYFGLDLDDSYEPKTGELTAWADEYVAMFATYTELSPSGQGVKAVGRGSLAGPGRRREGVELYDRDRYYPGMKPAQTALGANKLHNPKTGTDHADRIARRPPTLR